MDNENTPKQLTAGQIGMLSTAIKICGGMTAIVAVVTTFYFIVCVATAVAIIYAMCRLIQLLRQ